MPVKSEKYKQNQLQKAKDYVTKLGGTLLTNVYINCSQYLQVKCANEHEWEVRYNQLVNIKTWCPICHINNASIKIVQLAKEKSILINNEKDRQCKICNIIKPKTEFQRLNTTAISYTCKKCFNNKRKENRSSSKFNSLDSFIRHKLSGARHRAKNNNMDYNLDYDFIKKLYDDQCGKCKLSGESLTYKEVALTNLSIDRINSDLGYTKDNIQLVCEIINFMKLNLSIDNFIYFCQRIVDNKK